MTDKLKDALEAADRGSLVAAVKLAVECSEGPQAECWGVRHYGKSMACVACKAYLPTRLRNILKGKSDGKE